MKGGWKIKSLGEIVSFQRGLTYSKKDEVDLSANIVIRANNIDIKTNSLDFSELKYISDNVLVPQEKKVVRGSLIICTASGSKSHLGKVALIDDDYDYAFGGFMGQINPSNEIDSKYLFYCLISENYKDFIRRLSDGVNINNLRFDDLSKFSIPLPPLPEQERIVAILDQAFAAIAKAKENAEKNLKNAREVFDSYLNSVFANPGEDWEVRRLEEVCDYEKNPNKKNNLPYVGLEHIESNTGKFIGSFVPQNVKSLTFTFNQAHVLYGRLRPYLNKVMLPDFEGHCSTEIFPIKPQRELTRGLLFYWLISTEVAKKINSTWTGARMPRANMNQVLNFQIPIPPLDEQERIVRNLDMLNLKIKKLEPIYRQKIADLEEMKKSILHKAFK